MRSPECGIAFVATAASASAAAGVALFRRYSAAAPAAPCMKARREDALVWKKLARIDRSPSAPDRVQENAFTGRETKEIVIKRTGAVHQVIIEHAAGGRLYGSDRGHARSNMSRRANRRSFGGIGQIGLPDHRAENGLRCTRFYAY